MLRRALWIVVVVVVACRGPALPERARAGEVAGSRYVEMTTGGAGPAEALPLVVALHGYGGSPATLARRFADFPGRARWIFLEGERVSWDRFGWFTPASSVGERFPEILRVLARNVGAGVAGYWKEHPIVGKPIVLGFSQGAIVAYAVAVNYPRLVSHVFPLAGYFPPAGLPGAVAEPRPEVHAFHGGKDAVIPVDDARGTVARLRALGFRAALREFPAQGHGLDKAAMEEVYRELQRVLRRGADAGHRHQGEARHP